MPIVAMTGSDTFKYIEDGRTPDRPEHYTYYGVGQAPPEIQKLLGRDVDTTPSDGTGKRGSAAPKRASKPQMPATLQDLQAMGKGPYDSPLLDQLRSSKTTPAASGPGNASPVPPSNASPVPPLMDSYLEPKATGPSRSPTVETRRWGDTSWVPPMLPSFNAPNTSAGETTQRTGPETIPMHVPNFGVTPNFKGPGQPPNELTGLPVNTPMPVPGGPPPAQSPGAWQSPYDTGAASTRMPLGGGNAMTPEQPPLRDVLPQTDLTTMPDGFVYTAPNGVQFVWDQAAQRFMPR